ncbi:hypothetical protein NG800_015915 [Epilithonimonas ginsengisoli]|uniref:PIN domain-containing protein n=1 Tax=Epilithonimonas ginsengisoli TaxID=1245592 RepID=A0ABU4JL36_9FLAO|nr:MULTISPECIES: hypothetical protein [Chryseobacterium group]MBV6881444.1 hypothetical protein [Epilithonimonas sp. FP105]MDW8550414.1 hypothetical protein [Epilithonimonas ginsengisoli]OAH73275.1 hypothetical protein AXA65_08100 [Chryseobacterium sp. FP211-J200]
MKNKNRALTYSLLAYIRNNNDVIKGPIDIFVPLIKRTLSIINSQGIFEGKNISEIKNTADKEYSIDFPLPVLKKILHIIAKEINTEKKTNFVLNNDGSFQILRFSFTDFDDVINSKNEDIERIENLFKEFKESMNKDVIIDSESIFKFIEKNKFTLSKYLSDNSEMNGEDYTIEAQFVNFFKKSKPIYDLIKDIYIGSILTCYIEFKPENIKNDVELVLDTNFVIGLLDLNTPESTHTCRTLISIAKSIGYKISVFKCTIDETENLLKGKASNFDRSFLQRKVNPEDVYNACDRRNLSKVDLERISDNLIRELQVFEINIYYNHDNYTREAKNSSEYAFFKTVRNTDYSALHDATIITYVKKKRSRNIYDFEKVNCWFVNNSTSFYVENLRITDKKQPETIKADDLLNILWLSSPAINTKIDVEELANIGLTSSISLTLNKNLPKSRLLKELDDNISKYAEENISDADIVRVATRITNKQLIDIEEINQLANTNKEEFVKRLQKEADSQKIIEKEQIRKIDIVFKTFKSQNNQVIELKNEYKRKIEEIDKDKNDLSEAHLKIKKQEEEIYTIKVDNFIDTKIEKWRNNAKIKLAISVTFLIAIIFGAFYYNDFKIGKTTEYCKENILLSLLISFVLFIINGWFFKSLYDRYESYSNIENYKKGLKIPDKL